MECMTVGVIIGLMLGFVFFERTGASQAGAEALTAIPGSDNCACLILGLLILICVFGCAAMATGSGIH